jgi:hypothetical protein
VSSNVQAYAQIQTIITGGIMKNPCILFPFLMALATGLFARDIQYVEKFSLARDRSKALKELIPGTRDYYFYHALDAQNRGDRAGFDKVMKDWIARYKVTGRVKEMINRQALLDYANNPEKSIQHIRTELNIRFNHSRKVEGRKPSHATKVDPSHISHDAFLKRSLTNNTVSDVEPRSVWKLDPSGFNGDRMRHWLASLRRPDIPGLPGFIMKDLRHRNSRGFGSHTIHRNLLLEQLDNLLELDPGFINNTNFVNTYLRRLAPGDDIDIRYNPGEKEKYLNRLLQFVRRLAPAHNTLKATVIHEILQFQQSRGKHDRELFLEYLSLPRNTHYIQPRYRESLLKKGSHDIRFGQSFGNIILVPPIRNEETLVREFLLHFLREDDGMDGFVKFLRDTYLKPLLAEAKLVNGIGNPEKWFSLLGTSRVQALKDRIDIDFLPQNPTLLEPGDAVNLKVAVKNVDSLLIKAYRINTFNYYTRNLKPIDTALNLDGLSATWERTLEFDTPPLRRVERTLKFPELKGSGVFVVDLIGNGRSSRALVTKGLLRILEKTGPAGHEFRILDGRNQPRPRATLWMNGREYVPGKEDGVILVPYSNRPGRQGIVLKDGAFSVLSSFQHLAESYELRAGLHVDREALLRGDKATVTVRPVLRLNGWKVAPALLEEIRLHIQTADYDGVSTSTEVPIGKFADDAEFTHTFTVPAKLNGLNFALTAKIENVSQGRKQDLSASQGYQVNMIERTLKLDSPHLSRPDGRYVLDILGKNGEPLPDRPVSIEFKHKDFKRTHGYALKSDQNGRIHLTAMPGIEWIRVTHTDGQQYLWHIERDRHGRISLPGTLHAAVGEAIRVNLTQDPAGRKPAEICSLFQKRGDVYHSAHLRAGRFDDGCLVLDDLAAGNYELYLKDNDHVISILVTQGARNKEKDFIVSRHRHLEGASLQPLHIADIRIGGGKATIKLGNANPFTRLHVFATRYQPRFPAYDILDIAAARPPYSLGLVQPRTLFVEDRDIGEEYRYILERQDAPKFPGNLLGRPGVLLNPWAIRDTHTGRQIARAGEEYLQKLDEAQANKKATGKLGKGHGGQADFPNLDFLAQGTIHLANVKPGRNGTVVVDISKLAGQQQLHIVAVDPENTIYRPVSLKEADLETRENRMARSLDPEKPFSEQKLISFRKKGEAFELADITSSRLQVYDSIDKVHTLLLTLSGQNANLNEFSFILRWPGMKQAEKLEKYSRYSCHELNFFLYHKDNAFFKEVIKPYIANKKDKTFMDHWLLGADLKAYTAPWAFTRLNAVEKILLAHSGTAGAAAMERFIQEKQDLIPSDPDRFNHLFNTAIKSSSLVEEDGIGLAKAMKGLDGQLTYKLHSMDLGLAGKTVLGSSKSKHSALKNAAGLLSRRGPPTPTVATAGYAFQGQKELAENVQDFRSRAKAGMQLVAGDFDEEQEAAEGKPLDPSGFAYFNKRKDARKEVRQLFRKLESTKEWAENNYYKLTIESQDQDLVQVNAFWNDYAASARDEAFFSGNVIHATRNFAEMMLALAVIDLPFKTPEHDTDVENRTFKLKPGGPVILFHEEVKEAGNAANAGQILLSQNFYRADSRYRHVGNERLDNFVREEFLISTAYGCQVVLTNPTSARRKLNLLLQVPMGAMPLQVGFYSKGRPVTLEPYSTTTFDYYFYFPETGEYPIYPVQVASAKGHLAGGGKFVFKVVRELSRTDRTSWAWISQNGTEQEVIQYLQDHNINRIDLSLIAFRLRNKGEGGGGKPYYEKVLNLLAGRFAFHPVLWSYSIYHKDQSRMREYLPHTSMVQRSGLWLKSPLLDIDPVARRTYQHLEYKPLVNARAHTLGKTRKILNDRFHQQYHRFMEVLKYKPRPATQDELAVTYYLLLQDRIDEAFRHYAKATPQTLDEKLQHAYLTVYLDFLEGDTQGARQLAEKYRKYPVDKWRNLFVNALNQLDEVEGRKAAVADEENRDQKQDQLAATEPSLEFEVESGEIAIQYQNLGSVTLNYYPMDIELLFSRKPFVKEDHSHFTYIQPGFSHVVKLPKGQATHKIALPKLFQGSNVMVEAAAGGIRESKAYYANELAVQVIGNYGHIRVTHEDKGKPLAKVYVKVYCRLGNGQTRFYKDGYTDLRGRFDYVSLSTDELDDVREFSILVLSGEHGAVIKEAKPPKQ